MLVFCKAGISRSAAICIAYLMRQRRMSMDEAHDYVKSRRAFISPNLNFMRQLHEFDARLTVARAAAGSAGTEVAVGVFPPPSSPSRRVLGPLQCPPAPTVGYQRRRWLSTTPTIPVEFDAARYAFTGVTSPRPVDATTARCSEFSLLVPLSRPAAAAFLSAVVSPSFRGVGPVSAPTVGSGDGPICCRERAMASTPSQLTSRRRVFVYPVSPLPLNANNRLVLL